MNSTKVPYHRAALNAAAIDEVVATLKSGWLTTGPKTQRFESAFAEAVGAAHAVALNSCTAALHLAVEALGLRRGEGVLVPTMTFAATAEVVRYRGGVPILVDCDPVTLNMDLDDAERKIRRFLDGRPKAGPASTRAVVGMIPVHVGGLMMDVDRIREFAERHGLWVTEDAAHAFPAAWRPGPDAEWQRCGQGTSQVTCFSFYANKTITTGEGGMAVTDDADLAAQLRLMALHGLSKDAWNRYADGASWDYQILVPGYKYNLTDIAASIGIHQLEQAEAMRCDRERTARFYVEAFADTDEIDLPLEDPNRIHSWHLFPIRLRRDRLSIDRNSFMEEMKRSGVGCSVHWRPLHLHPYYEQTFAWRPEDNPVASTEWERLISLPIYPGMQDGETARVVEVVKAICSEHSGPRWVVSRAANGRTGRGSVRDTRPAPLPRAARYR